MLMRLQSISLLSLSSFRRFPGVGAYFLLCSHLLGVRGSEGDRFGSSWLLYTPATIHNSVYYPTRYIIHPHELMQAVYSHRPLSGVCMHLHLQYIATNLCVHLRRALVYATVPYVPPGASPGSASSSSDAPVRDDPLVPLAPGQQDCVWRCRSSSTCG